MRPFFVCLTFSCYLLLSPVMMTSQTVGHIDQGFAKNGMSTLDKDVSQDDPHYVSTQPDGKILQVGKAYRKDSDLIVVRRLYEDGTLDKSFGTNGRVEIHIDGEVHDIASPNMEHIYLVGLVKSRQDKDFLIIRLLYDGSIDKDFADFGKKVLNLGGTDEAYALTFQKDGKILIGGNTYAQSWTQRDFALVRLLPSGKMDAEFGNGGIKRIDVGKYDSFQSMIIQEDDKILVCGYTKPDRFTRFAVFRLETNGNPDPKFDGDGIKILETGVENNFCEGIALDKDQNILLMGHARRSKESRGFDFVVVKLFPNGMSDRGFGNTGTGIAYIDLGGTEYATGMHMQADGNFLLLGTSNHKVTIVRITEFGSKDLSFGINGQMRNENTRLGREKLYDYSIQADNKILLAGMSNEAPIVTRVHGNPDILGVEEILMAPWEGGLSKSKKYASLEISTDFSLNVWLEGEYLPDNDPVLISQGSGAESILPIKTFATERAYVQIGDSYKLTALWDTDEKLHIYLNGKYAYTFAE